MQLPKILLLIAAKLEATKDANVMQSIICVNNQKHKNKNKNKNYQDSSIGNISIPTYRIILNLLLFCL